MVVQIAHGAMSRWREGRLQFRVQSPVSIDRLRPVVEGIAEVLLGELHADGPLATFVRDLVVLPDGLAFWLDAPDAGPELIDRIVSTIIDGLESAGIDGQLSAPPRLPEAPHGPWIHAVAVPAHPGVRDACPLLPRDGVDRALSWVLEGVDGDVAVESGAVELTFPVPEAIGLVDRWLAAGRSVTVTADRDGDRRRCHIEHPAAAEGPYADCPHLSISMSGESVRTDLDASFERLVDQARELGRSAAWVYASAQLSSYLKGPSPYWMPPGGWDPTIALSDQILEVHAWQRLRPGQAARLPAKLHFFVTFDAASGELRLGSLDDWLRARWIGAPVRPPFTPMTRVLVGDALATRDEVWERLQSLPTSLPAPADEPAFEPPALDASQVELVGFERAHSSLGVSALGLFALERRLSHHLASVLLSGPLQAWLGHLPSRPPDLAAAPLRRVVRSLAERTRVGPEHPSFHRRLMADWLVRTLTPRLAALAGLDDVDRLGRIPSLNVAHRPVDITEVLLGCLRPAAEAVGVSVRWQRAGRPDAVDVVDRVISAAVFGALFRDRETRSSFAACTTALWDHVRSHQQPDRSFALELWREAATAEGVDTFRHALGDAALVFPRDAYHWHEIERQVWIEREFEKAAGVTIFNSSNEHGDDAWDKAIAAGREAAPGNWERFTGALAERLPTYELAGAWSGARGTVNALRDVTWRNAAHAVVVIPAQALCTLATDLALAAGREDDVIDLVWAAVEELVPRLDS